MGKGKGSVAYWAAKVKSGTVLFEMCGVDDLKSIPAFKTGGAKLPIKTIIFN
jgi:large subunit ribosomal protein L16